eukprot:TRINITY_DN9373_c0_g1_i5.p2 TRINITY_DN9373_c0_g1~~TRINITY_DN9373_c0_g1_i5.p2  ORF type:complete len:236 (-),score=33.42 TRINITY_DN9373_c0_g1_i5:51-758(-)
MCKIPGSANLFNHSFKKGTDPLRAAWRPLCERFKQSEKSNVNWDKLAVKLWANDARPLSVRFWQYETSNANWDKLAVKLWANAARPLSVRFLHPSNFNVNWDKLEVKLWANAARPLSVRSLQSQKSRFKQCVAVKHVLIAEVKHKMVCALAEDGTRILQIAADAWSSSVVQIRGSGRAGPQDKSISAGHAQVQSLVATPEGDSTGLKSSKASAGGVALITVQLLDHSCKTKTDGL